MDEQKQTLTVPVAIIIAGVLVAGAVFFSNLGPRGGLGAVIGGTNPSREPKTGTIQYSTEDLKRWAASIGLDAGDFTTCIDSQRYTQHVKDDAASSAARTVGGTPSFFITGVVPGKSVFIEEALPYRVFEGVITAYETFDKTNTSEVAEVSVRPDDHVLGDPGAPIAIIEYSDFQCPFCRSFFNDTLPSIKKNFVETGKAKLIYRHFPLNFHPAAQPSAEAAECANDQGKFWEMHDAIFTKQVE